MLKSGQAHFAAMDFSGAEVLAGKGTFTEWRAVAAIHQQTLVSIMTTTDTGIAEPADLTGKTIATAKGSVSELLFPAYAKLAGFDPGSVTMQGTQPTALNGLMAQRRVDAVSTFLLSRAAAILNKAEPTAAIPAAVGEIQAMKQFVPPPGGQAIGFLDRQRVVAGIAELESAGLIPAGLTPERVADFRFAR
jgi:ABC-type nitrate/sulfonate/bicarbonate transport system substrate-binding protein